MRNSPPSKSSSNVSIRGGASELPTKRKSTTIVGTVLGIVSALAVALGIFSVFIWRRRQTDRAVTQIQQGKTINVVEKDVVEAADMEEVRRACVIVLLCIQEDDEVRPSMRQVVQMLEGKMEPQPPQIPSYAFMDKHVDQSDIDSYGSYSHSVLSGLLV
ncbi:hypothetical protein SUGI_0257330 [Cryptomeria japonica]|nr:hypothetical protein SUGI_0257330 [Cryptomeria japonica]